MKYQKKYTIQEFANMCHVTKDTLFHYHRMKLIKPTINESNHYREYTIDQLLTFHRIMLFKKSGCTLTEIEDYLYHKDAELLPSILDESRRRLNEKLRETQRAIQQLDTIEAAIMYAQDPANRIPHVEVWKQVKYIVTTPAEGKNLSWDGTEIKDLCNHLDYCEAQNAVDPFPIGHILTPLQDHMPLACHKLFSMSREQIDSERCQEIPAGRYLCHLHRGKLDKIPSSITELVTYASKCGIRPLGNLYVCNLIDSFTVFAEEDFVTMLFVRIE